MPVVEVIAPAAWRTQSWANGAGVTHEVARWGSGAAFDARLSVAELTARSPFSRFEGYDRWLAPSGGVTLVLPDGPRRLRLGDALTFAGELDVVGEPDAPTWELNVMVRRGIAWSAEVVAARTERDAPAGVTALFAFAPVRVEVAGAVHQLDARATLLATSSTGFAVTAHATADARVALVHLDLRSTVAPTQVTVTLDGDRIVGWDSFHDECAAAFGFPDFYGRNMDAWIDCLTGLDDRDGVMTTVSTTPGGVVVLELLGAKGLAARCPEVYAALVECSAFVNWRRRERGHPAVLALSFYG